jgi:glyoxylase-like metal-dependent hydrolase (beta-lactamase superfamily II)
VFAGDVLMATGPVPHHGEYPDFRAQLSAIGEHLLTLPGPTRVLPGHSEVERARLRDLAASLGLVTTEGSDDHGDLTGHRLGVEATSPAAFERLMALAAGSGG